MSNTSLPAVELDNFQGVGVAADVMLTLHLAVLHCRVPQQRPYQLLRGSSDRGRSTPLAFEPQAGFYPHAHIPAATKYTRW